MFKMNVAGEYLAMNGDPENDNFLKLEMMYL